LISGGADLIVPPSNENVSEEFRHSRRCAISAGSIIPGKCLFGLSIFLKLQRGRQELGRKSQDLARLLKTARAAALAVPADHQFTAAFATLDAVAASGVSKVTPG
jgi:hypothetical protein